MKVSVNPSCDCCTFCQVIIVGGGGLRLDELEQSCPAPVRASTAGQRLLLQAFMFYKLWSSRNLKYKKLFNVCLHWQLLQKLGLDPKHKMGSSITIKYKSFGHVDPIPNHLKLGNLTIRNLLSGNSVEYVSMLWSWSLLSVLMVWSEGVVRDAPLFRF